jgi:tRNA-dihydrouridine synthase A
MSQWDALFFGAPHHELDRAAIEQQMVDYMERVGLNGEPWSRVVRHMLGLRNGLPGARRWRQVWSDHKLKTEPARAVARIARSESVAA